MNLYTHKKAFSMVELLIVMGILALLFATGTMSLLNTQHNAYLNSNTTALLSDMRRQQMKSMLGDTNGGATTYNYGIHFNTTNYVLFRGTVYSASDPNNLVINLENNIQFSNINVPSAQIVFGKGSGDFLSFVNGTNTITIRDITNSKQKVITINRYGLITSVN